MTNYCVQCGAEIGEDEAYEQYMEDLSGLSDDNWAVGTLEVDS